MAVQKFKNNAYTILNDDLTNSATSIVVSDGSVFGTVGSPDYMMLTLYSGVPENKWEIVKVTNITANTLTVTRAQDGTAGVSWSSGDQIGCRLNAGSIYGYGGAPTFTDLTVTNAIAGSVTGNAATVTNATLTTALTNQGGAGVLAWPGAGATLTVPTGGGTLGTAAFTAATAYLAAAGTAAKATVLETTRAINGVDFDGSAAITTPVNNANDTTNADYFALFTSTAGGNYAALTNAGFKFHPSTGILTCTGFAGPLVGNVTGDVSGSAGSASTVTNATLTTALTVNTGTVTLTGNAANTSTLTIGAGAVSVAGANTGDVTLAADHGLGLTGQQLTMGTPSTCTAASTNAVSSATHTHAITGFITSLTGAVLTDQTAGQTIGATGTRLTMLWATDITCTNAISGSLAGNAATVTNATFTTAFTNQGGAGVLVWPGDGATLTVPTGGGTLGTGAWATIASYASLAAPSFTGGITSTATTDAALSGEYITDIANRDFSVATDWTGTGWIRPLLAVGQANDITVSASGKTFTRTTGSFINDGFQVGMTVTWSGFAKGGTVNNNTFTTTTVTALVMTCSAATLSDEIPADYTSCSCVSPVWSHPVAGANAATLANARLTAAPADTNIYQLTVTAVTKTLGTLSLGIGGGSIGNTIGRAVATETAYVANVVCTTAGVLTINPSAAWVGWIDDISAKKVTPSTSILTGKTAAAATGIETIAPNSTSLGIGVSALKGCVQTSCTASGYYALYLNTGSSCTASGYYALYQNTGAYCTASGYSALYQNTGAFCTASGYYALHQNTGSSCTANGYSALYQNTGAYCTASGYYALYQNTGANNVAIGYQAGYHATYHAQNSCTFLGYNTTVSSDSLTNSTALGNGATITASNQCVIGNSSLTAITTTASPQYLSGTAVPAGGTAGAGLKMSSTSNLGVFFGSGAPTLAAAKGSLYLRTDGSTTNDRMYVNTNGSTTWTAVTTAA